MSPAPPESAGRPEAPLDPAPPPRAHEVPRPTGPNWLGSYPREALGHDLLAGATLAAYALPVSLAYAALAGLPPQTGIYGYLLGGLAYAACGTSRHLAVGPTAALSLVVGVTLARLAGGDPAQAAALAPFAALAVAGAFALAWLLRLSFMANFVSESILTGFKAGAALAILSTQLPKFLGLPEGGTTFLSRMAWVGSHLGALNLAALVTGLGALALLLTGERFWPGRPAALGVLALALLAVPALDLTRHGLAIVGTVPGGLPHLGGQALLAGPLTEEHTRELLKLGFACFLLACVESLSTARTFALRDRYDINPRRELFALGVANFAVALGQGYPVAGGLSQTAVNRQAGARTPLALVAASLTLGLILLLLTGLFANLPQTVLAAIVLMAVMGLIDTRELRHLWTVSRFDFAAALAAFLGVLLLGILDGVILAVMASLALLLVHTSRPHVAYLGRIPGTARYSDRARHPDNEPLPGVLAFRVEAGLLYFNAQHIFETVLTEVSQRPDLKEVVCDLSTSPTVDVAGARMLVRLHDELATTGIRFHVAEAHGRVRDILRAEGLEDRLGHISRKVSLEEILARCAPSTDSGAARPAP